MTRDFLDKAFFYAKAFLLAAGLALTFLSLSEICSQECAEVHNYKLYGSKFEYFGLLFFASGLILHFASRFSPYFPLLLALAVSASVGSEIYFILFQKYVIGTWCPVCLTIAATVGILALVMLFEYALSIKNEKQRNVMYNLFRGSLSIGAVALGFLIAFIGIAKPEKSFAEGVNETDPVFGNKNSNVEVYIVTDWFCPACKRADPAIEEAMPDLFKSARVFFIDKIIHQESMNYLPYNLSFMINNKKQYVQIRKALIALTDKTKEPTLEDIQNAIKPLGVTYKQLNYSDINSGMRFFEGIVKHFEIHQTPTVVVANRRTMKAKKIIGKDINKENLLESIKEMQ